MGSQFYKFVFFALFDIFWNYILHFCFVHVSSRLTQIYIAFVASWIAHFWCPYDSRTSLFYRIISILTGFLSQHRKEGICLQDCCEYGRYASFYPWEGQKKKCWLEKKNWRSIQEIFLRPLGILSFYDTRSNCWHFLCYDR